MKANDIVYFKNSGEPVMIVANVSKIQEFENLNSKKVREILEKYGEMMESLFPTWRRLLNGQEGSILHPYLS